jgi:haloacetate dehalogenase
MVGGPIAGMEYRRLEIRDADYLVALAGSGSPVLLLHGFPQTHFCWRGVLPSLSESHTLVAPDLRGYGATSAPAGGPRGEGFTKREMANDLVELMTTLGFDRFAVVGHDRGARVAYRMALDHPANVDRLVVLNVIPTVDQFERMSAPSLGYWPWFLLAQPAPFPEKLIAASPEHFLRFIFNSWAAEPTAIDEAAFDEYRRALREPTITSICADYRASFWLDRHDDAADRRAGRRIACPMLVITGDEETQPADAETVWRAWADDLRATTLPGGHFIPEEATAPLATALIEFLSPTAPGA